MSEDGVVSEIDFESAHEVIDELLDRAMIEVVSGIEARLDATSRVATIRERWAHVRARSEVVRRALVEARVEIETKEDRKRDYISVSRKVVLFECASECQAQGEAARDGERPMDQYASKVLLDMAEHLKNLRESP